MVKLCSFAALLPLSVCFCLSLSAVHFKLVITRNLPQHPLPHTHTLAALLCVCVLTYVCARIFAYCLPRHNAKMRVTSFLKPNINSGICTCVYPTVCAHCVCLIVHVCLCLLYACLFATLIFIHANPELLLFICIILC